MDGWMDEKEGVARVLGDERPLLIAALRRGSLW